MKQNTDKVPFYIEEILVPDADARRIVRYLNCEPESEKDCLSEDERFDYEATFPDGRRMAVQCCGVQYEEGGCNTAWTQAVLFDVNGAELVCSEPEDTFLGTWRLTYDECEYIVTVVPDYGLECK